MMRSGQPVRPGSAPEAVLPTPLQLLFFRTAMCSKAELGQLWQEFSEGLQNDGAGLAGVSQHLCLLHRRLQPGQSDELALAVRRAYRQTWAANQMLFASLRECLQALQAAGVRALVLKGAAVLAANYGDMGLRSMGDFDVLVPQADFARAVAVLTSAGWKPLHPEEGFDPRFAHALAMIDGSGNNLDLHSHVLHFTAQKDADELFWQAAVPLPEQRLNSLQLCSADCVLHLAVHGLRWSPHPQLRWIPDIVQMLRSSPMDWERLLSMTEHLHASIAVSTVLNYLVEQGFAEVPREVLTALEGVAVGPGERELFELSTRDTFSGIGSTARFHWHIMTQGEAQGTLLRKLRLLPAYLSHRRKTREFTSWYDLLLAGFWRHLLSKFGRYDRSATGERLR